MVVLEASIDAVTERAEEGGLELRRPAESGALAVAGSVVTARGVGRDLAAALKGLGGAVVVFGHVLNNGGMGRVEGWGSIGSSDCCACNRRGHSGTSAAYGAQTRYDASNNMGLLIVLGIYSVCTIESLRRRRRLGVGKGSGSSSGGGRSG